MAEVKRRSFDLNSGGGLTDLLQAARKSTLDPTSYAQFRDLVLKHAQLKGSDLELKKKIESIASSLVFPSENLDVASSQNSNIGLSQKGGSGAAALRPASHGRRTLPSFAARPASPRVVEIKKEVRKIHAVPEISIPDKAQVPPPAEIRKEVPVEEVIEKEVQVEIPPPPPGNIPQEETAELRTVEEYKTRILEIKRRVNNLVGNPATLMDHGNTVGRDYMTALLGALKATSPGSTQNIDEAMTALESAFEKIIHREDPSGRENSKASQVIEKEEPIPAPEPEIVSETPSEAVPVEEIQGDSEEEGNEEVLSEPEEVIEENREDAEPSIPEVSLADFSANIVPQEEEIEEIPKPEDAFSLPFIETDEEEEVSENVSEEEAENAASVPEDREEETDEADSVANEGEGEDAAPLLDESDIEIVDEQAALAAKETIAALRAQLAQQDNEIAAMPAGEALMSIPETGGEPAAPPPARPHRKLPSILDMAEGDIPGRQEPTVPSQPPQQEGRSDLRSLTERPATLASQAELFSPEVTNILKHILHDWNIFASSGLFGMGPSGFEHPLYEKISTLSMGEVLSGRFENANMKIVHIIKDYVDAWRHEQGVAYNPSETFEHYLRRVAERIRRRQNVTEKV